MHFNGHLQSRAPMAAWKTDTGKSLDPDGPGLSGAHNSEKQGDPSSYKVQCEN